MKDSIALPENQGHLLTDMVMADGMIEDQSLVDVEQTLRKGGRSFHWARRFLGAEMGHNAARLYAFCRLVDDMADGDIADGPARLAVIRDDLKNRTNPRDPAFAVFAPFMEDHHIPHDAVVALVDGLLMDQHPVRIADQKELLRYCYRVAGTVGLMMCRILNARGEAAHAFAIDLGIAMQLTNIARDVLEDARMGRRYLPASWVGDIAPETITAASVDDQHPERQAITNGVKQLLNLAEGYYASGVMGLNFLPLRAHLAILVAARVYRQIGVQLKAGGYTWHQGRAVTSAMTKAKTSLGAAPMISRRRHGLPRHDAKLHIGLEGLPHVDA